MMKLRNYTILCLAAFIYSSASQLLEEETLIYYRHHNGEHLMCKFATLEYLEKISDLNNNYGYSPVCYKANKDMRHILPDGTKAYPVLLASSEHGFFLECGNIENGQVSHCKKEVYRTCEPKCDHGFQSRNSTIKCQLWGPLSNVSAKWSDLNPCVEDLSECGEIENGQVGHCQRGIHATCEPKCDHGFEPRSTTIRCQLSANQSTNWSDPNPCVSNATKIRDEFNTVIVILVTLVVFSVIVIISAVLRLYWHRKRIERAMAPKEFKPIGVGGGSQSSTGTLSTEQDMPGGPEEAPLVPCRVGGGSQSSTGTLSTEQDMPGGPEEADPRKPILPGELKPGPNPDDCGTAFPELIPELRSSSTDVSKHENNQMDQNKGHEPIKEVLNTRDEQLWKYGNDFDQPLKSSDPETLNIKRREVSGRPMDSYAYAAPEGATGLDLRTYNAHPFSGERDSALPRHSDDDDGPSTLVKESFMAEATGGHEPTIGCCTSVKMLNELNTKQRHDLRPVLEMYRDSPMENSLAGFMKDRCHLKFEDIKYYEKKFENNVNEGASDYYICILKHKGVTIGHVLKYFAEGKVWRTVQKLLQVHKGCPYCEQFRGSLPPD